MPSDLYYAPEKFGLTTIGEVDFSSGDYCFDYTVVWQRQEDGAFLFGDDAGCSCPSPFEDTGLNDLTVAKGIGEIITHLGTRQSDSYYDRSGEIARLVELMHTARKEV